jgi:hypothetical protein
VDREQQYQWWKRVVWISGSILTLVVVLVLIRLGYAYRATGFGQYKVNGEVQSFKTLWDWLDLLIVPIVLAIGGYLFTRSETRRTQKTADQERTLDREIADERRQDDMLQAYLDGMSQLLTDKDLPLHRAHTGDSMSTVARARTLTVLGTLDSGRKGSVLQFLSKSGLIYKEYTLLKESGLIERRRNIVSLKRADLRRADMNGANLRGADLSFVDTSEADLRVRGADMNGADLEGANLSRANLEGANLDGVNLSEANLSRANLDGVNLQMANLRGTYEYWVQPFYPTGALMDEMMMSEDPESWEPYPPVKQLISNEKLRLQTSSLEHAIMPNGQEYEDWLIDKERSREDGENGSP